VLAAVVLTAVAGLLDVPVLLRMWRLSRIDFLATAIALVAVLLLGILDGILTAAAASVLLILARASRPHVAFLGPPRSPDAARCPSRCWCRECGAGCDCVPAGSFAHVRQRRRGA
jgi:MFS superfamily sulfate permease-like transporter